MFSYINHYFESLDRRRCLYISLTGCLLLGLVDFLSGMKLTISLFYTIVVMFAAWYGGTKVGLSVSLFATATWLVTDLTLGRADTSLLILSWNILVRFGFLLIILQLILTVREKLALEQSLADTDTLTGLANRRFFQEQLDRECTRIHRYPEPFTIAYFDLDDFKYINDSMGHDVGDQLLQTVAGTLTKNIRASDYAARLGGDEFAILFPALNQPAALPLLNKLHNELLLAMQQKAWPVTFSLGAVTFTQAMDSSRDMVRQVDDLMYEAKKSGKNSIRHRVWPIPEPAQS